MVFYFIMGACHGPSLTHAVQVIISAPIVEQSIVMTTFVCLSVCLFVCPRVFIWIYVCDLYQLLYACFLCRWLSHLLVTL